MNNKGFTLVEVLAVFAILSLVIVIVASVGLRGVGDTKNKINEQSTKGIEEGINEVLVEVENCDDDFDDWKELKELFEIDASKKGEINSCETLKNALASNASTKVKMDLLKSKGYVSGDVTDEDYYISYSSSNNKGSIVHGSVNNKLPYKHPVDFQSTGKTCAIMKINITPNSAGTFSLDWSTSGHGSAHNPLILTFNGEEIYGYGSGSKTYNLTSDATTSVWIEYSTSYSSDVVKISNLVVSTGIKDFSVSHGYRHCGNGFEEITH